MRSQHQFVADCFGEGSKRAAQDDCLDLVG